MVNGSIRHNRRLSFLLLGALTLLTGCFQFDWSDTVSWSPSGRRVAFIADDKAWIYDTQTGAMAALPSRRGPSGVSWSPSESLIATSTAGLVELYVEGEPGVFASSSVYAMPFLGSGALSLLTWHPSGRKLLDSEIGDKVAETLEIDISSREVARLGDGFGAYGPDPSWLLWENQAPIGKRSDKMIFDRQTAAGESLPLDPEAAELLESGVQDTITGTQDQRARLPLCASRENQRRGRTDFYCFDAEGELRRRASLPTLGRVFADQARRLFAVVEEKKDQEPGLVVIDADGRRRADGKKLLDAVRAESDDHDSDSRHASRLAWSPDGNWIAWVVDGRLYLWNWRNDVVRVHAPPA